MFWEMTIGEILSEIEANQEKEKEDLQIQETFIYKIGDLIRVGFHDPNKYPSSPQKAFEGTGIFPVRQDWRIMKERMNKYANLHKKRGESI